MPSKSRKICAYPGCRELSKNTYCTKHEEKVKEQRAQSNRFYDENVRDKKVSDFYKSKEWENTRQAVLTRDNGLCQKCLKEQRITFATTVHHIIEVKKDWNKRLDMNNLISLCSSCHNKIHGKGQGGVKKF